MFFEQTKSRFIEGTVIDRVLKSVAVAIFRLPLQSAGAPLIETARRRLGNQSEHRCIESGRLDVWIDRHLNLLLQSHPGGQHTDSQHFGSYVARQIGNAHVVEAWFTARVSLGAQERAPLNKPSLRTADLRSASIGIARTPVTPGGIRPLTVTASRL